MVLRLAACIQRAHGLTVNADIALQPRQDQPTDPAVQMREACRAATRAEAPGVTQMAAKSGEGCRRRTLGHCRVASGNVRVAWSLDAQCSRCSTGLPRKASPHLPWCRLSPQPWRGPDPFQPLRAAAGAQSFARKTQLASAGLRGRVAPVASTCDIN